MHRAHIAVSAINLLSLAAVLIFYFSDGKPAVFGLGIVTGYIANAAALLDTLVTSVYVGARALTGRGGETFHRHWVGVVNGPVVLAAWSPVLFHWRIAL
jgi:hypothetical protein